MVMGLTKIQGNIRAEIDADPGWPMGFGDVQEAQKVTLSLREPDKITEASKIAYSELVRDFLSLPISEAK